MKVKFERSNARYFKFILLAVIVFLIGCFLLWVYKPLTPEFTITPSMQQKLDDITTQETKDYLIAEWKWEDEQLMRNEVTSFQYWVLPLLALFIIRFKFRPEIDWIDESVIFLWFLTSLINSIDYLKGWEDRPVLLDWQAVGIVFGILMLYKFRKYPLIKIEM